MALAGSACASGGGGGAAGPAGPLPDNRGFDGGSQVAGGFTNQASAVLDSVVPAPRNQVWAVMPDVFRRLEIEASMMNPAAFQIGNPGSRVARIAGSSRLSQYLDCGVGVLGPNADTYEVTLQLVVQLVGAAGGGTLVRTTLDAYARPRSSAGDPLHCASQRTLERLVLSLVTEELRGPAPGEGATASLPPMSAGRLPRAGDLLRVECRSPLTDGTLVGQARFVGAGNGAVVLQVDQRGTSVPVPAHHVIDVDILERRSRTGLGGLLGAIAGATAGGLYGNTHEYDPNERRTYHFGKGVFIGVGAVVGAVGGFLVGRLTGSLFKSDVWHQAPPEWAIRTSGATTGAPPSPCPSFDAG